MVCVGCGKFAKYVSFKVGQLSNYEMVKENYISVTFISGAEFYVCVYLVYMPGGEVGVCLFGVVYD